MALAISDIHEKGIVHFDLHSANFIKDELGYPILIDFGCSQTGITHPNKGANKDGVGWSGWHVPEFDKQDGECGKLGDWYMFGHFVYCALDGGKLMEGRAKRHVTPEEEYIPDAAKDLITRLTIHDPNKRLGLNGSEEILNHPFFEGIDWEKLRRKEYVLKKKPSKTRAETLAEFES